MSVEQAEQAIRKYLAEEMLRDRDVSQLDSDYPLLDEGAIDSMDLQRLVAFLEESFDVLVPDECLVPENFESIGAIARLIERLQAGA